MGIFPKKKKVRKLIYGGPVGAVDSPTLGIGLQYRATAPQVPNLEAAQYLDQQYALEQQKMEEARNKLTPDIQAIREQIMRAPGPIGGKEKLFSEVSSVLDTLKKKTKEDPNSIFDDESTRLIRSIDDVLSPDRFQSLQDTYKGLEAGREAMLKNNTGNNIQIVNGKAKAVDKDGNVKYVPVDDVTEESGLKFVTLADAYNQASSAKTFDPIADGYDFNGFQKTQEDAMSEIQKAFSSATGSSAWSTALAQGSSNRAALNQAREEIKGSLTQESRDALMSQYIAEKERNGERPTSSGFESYLNAIVDSEMNKRLQTTSMSKVDPNDLLRAQKNAASGNGSYLEQTYIPSASNLTVGIDRTAMGRLFHDTEKSLIRYADSTRPVNSSLQLKDFSGSKVYAYGESSDYKTSTDDDADNNEPVVIKGSRNVQQTGAVLLPVLNGIMFKKPNVSTGKWEEGTLSKDMEQYKGKPLSGRDDDDALFDPTAKPQRDEQGRWYMEDKQGNRYGVSFRGFDVYSEMTPVEGSNKMQSNGVTILEEQSLQRSVQAFGDDFSATTYNQSFVQPNGLLNPNGIQAVRTIESALPGFSATIQGLIKKYAEEKRKNPGNLMAGERHKQQISQAINEALHQMDIQAARNSIVDIPTESTKISGNNAIIN